METEILKSDIPMNTIIGQLVAKSGANLAAFGGGLAVVLTFAADLAQWVAICGGALGLFAGALGIYSKVQEIKLNNLKILDMTCSQNQNSK